MGPSSYCKGSYFGILDAGCWIKLVQGTGYREQGTKSSYEYQISINTQHSRINSKLKTKNLKLILILYKMLVFLHPENYRRIRKWLNRKIKEYR
jgi:hypothetical protein